MSELKTLIDYIPAQLHECKSRWYIDFHVYHPIGKRLYRQQLRINRMVSISERRRFAKRLVQKINLKLANGWNPFTEQKTPKSFYHISLVSKQSMRMIIRKSLSRSFDFRITSPN